jgi:hypothetical protein
MTLARDMAGLELVSDASSGSDSSDSDDDHSHGRHSRHGPHSVEASGSTQPQRRQRATAEASDTRSSIMEAFDSLDLGKSSARRRGGTVTSKAEDRPRARKRNAPEVHAASTDIGSRLRGLDGQWYTCATRSDGMHFWRKESEPKPHRRH